MDPVLILSVSLETRAYRKRLKSEENGLFGMFDVYVPPTDEEALAKSSWYGEGESRSSRCVGLRSMLEARNGMGCEFN